MVRMGGILALVLGFTLVVVEVSAEPSPSTVSGSWTPAVATSAQVADTFPHSEHQGLFPLCQGCHEGIDQDAGVAAYPEPAECAGCHDGVDYDEVDWTPPAPVDGLVVFSHGDHLSEVLESDEPAVVCGDCHLDPDGESMSVAPLEAEKCLTCHEEGSDDHFSELNDCASCHQPVGQAQDGEARLAAMESPEAHEGRIFLLEEHGADALETLNRCATCHVENQCVACHVDPGLEPIPQVPVAPAAWHVPLPEPEYPEPDSHLVDDYESLHGRPAPGAPDCSTCHTKDDCAACHLSPLPPVVEELQERPQVRAPGVGLEDQLPSSHDTPFFLPTHPVYAAASPDGCASCHTQAYCAECHETPVRPGYHPSNFSLAHAATAQSQPQECSNCHSTAAFCRECHTSLGMGSVGRLGAGYHDAEPIWLLRHGAAARQGLEQCASCHEQRDCMQCHSNLGAFQVNPHGPDFDAARAYSRNPLICRACHLGGPPGFGG